LDRDRHRNDNSRGENRHAHPRPAPSYYSFATTPECHGSAPPVQRSTHVSSGIISHAEPRSIQHAQRDYAAPPRTSRASHALASRQSRITVWGET
jgi:hypothetical protein